MCAKFKWQEEKDDGKPDWCVDGSSSTRGEKAGAEVQQTTWWDRHGRKALFSMLWILVGIVIIIALSFHFTNRIKAVGTVEPHDIEYITAPIEGTVELISVIEGQTVKEGELLAKIRPDNIGSYKNVEVKKFDRLIILAPRDGQIIRRDKETGEHVKNGDLVFALAPDRKMVLLVKVSPDDLSKIQIGQKVLIYPRSFSQRFSGIGEGRVIQVGTYARLQGQQGQVTYVPVKVLVEKSRSPLVAGSFADVVILTSNP